MSIRPVDSGRSTSSTGATPPTDPAAAPPLASVIIPTRNAAGTIGEQLTALAEQDDAPPFEVIVVDNLSNDGSADVVSQFALGDRRFRYVPADDGVGVNNARIVGSQAARSDLLLYCDADDIVDLNWVREMVKGLLSFDLVGGVLDEDRLSPSAPPGCRAGRMSGLLQLDISDWPFASGACVGIRRRALESIGGWRAGYPPRTAGDDVDLSWRCHAAGHTVGFIPTAVVHYRNRSNTRLAMKQFYRYGKSVPYLYRLHRQESAVSWRPRSPGARRRWTWLLEHAPGAIVDRHVRHYWLREASFVVGRCSGCLRYRVLCL